jgi:hypothetical protein
MKSKKSNLIKVVALGVLALAATSAAYSDPMGRDVLLRAINFALTGTADKYAFDDTGTCTVHRGEEFFYLDHVDASRITFEKKSKEELPSLGTNQVGMEVREWIEVTLHGEEVVYENRIPSYRENGRGERFNDPPIRKADITLKLETKEADRLIRAWKYVYTHGCKSSSSSF